MADTASNERIIGYLPQVRQLARMVRRRNPRHFDEEELYAVGALALCVADTRWEARPNVSYATFVQHRVLGSMIDHLRSQYGRRVAVRIADMATEEEKQQARQTSLAKRYGRKPLTVQFSASVEEATTSGVPREGDIASPASCVDVLSQNEAEQCARVEAERILGLDFPSANCVQVLRMRHMEGYSMEVIGPSLGVTASRASQIHTQAIRHARNRLHVSRALPLPTFTAKKEGRTAGGLHG